MIDRVWRSLRVVTPEGTRPASVHVTAGTITHVRDHGDVPAGCPLEDVGDLVLMPGIVDTHVHINDPGRADWEGFETATRAAAAGGVTTLVDMPLNSIPPTTTLLGLEAKARAAEGRCTVDVGFVGGVVPGNDKELRTLFEAGALGFKCFLAESGVDEFSHVNEPELRLAMAELAKLGAPLLVHAELPGPLAAAASRQGEVSAEDARKYATYLASRPRAAEDEAVEMVIRLSNELRAHAHVVHLSSSDALRAIRRAKDEGVPVSAETCPHYLSFAAEEIPDGATSFKCAPPIRERKNREALWDALREGLIDQVVTDHSPSTLALKCSGSGDFVKAWGGISSLQLGLAAVWTEARARGRTIDEVARWMCGTTARLVGLEAKKGSITAGCDADFVAWDPDAEFRVDPKLLQHKNKLTPYEGRALIGSVVTTWLRGAKIYDRGRFEGAPRGGWLKGSR